MRQRDLNASRTWVCDVQAQRQMAALDEGWTSSSMGLSRITRWLQVLGRSGQGSIKLGHGSLTPKSTLTKDPGKVKRTMKLWEDVRIESIQVEF